MDDLLTVSLASLAVLTIAAVILILVLKKNPENRKSKEPNYQVFLALAVSFIPLGFIFMVLSVTSDFPFAVGIPFVALGIMYLAIGLSGRNKNKTS